MARLIDADKLEPDCISSKRGTFAISASQIANAPTVCDIEQIRDEIEKLEPFDSLYDYSDAIKDVLEVIDRYTK